MLSDFEVLSQIIHSRRSVFPAAYSDQKIEDQVILDILENARWAPTHKMTEPWIFKIISGHALQSLGEFLANQYKKSTPVDEFKNSKYQKNLVKPTKCSHIIAICLHRDPQQKIPEWEEVAAVSCAVMNIWLSCNALGIAGYWSTPKSASEASELLNLIEGQKCLGFFYMGYPKEPITGQSRRKEISQFTDWIK